MRTRDAVERTIDMFTGKTRLEDPRPKARRPRRRQPPKWYAIKDTYHVYGYSDDPLAGRCIGTIKSSGGGHWVCQAGQREEVFGDIHEAARWVESLR